MQPDERTQDRTLLSETVVDRIWRRHGCPTGPCARQMRGPSGGGGGGGNPQIGGPTLGGTLQTIDITPNPNQPSQGQLPPPRRPIGGTHPDHNWNAKTGR